MGVKAEAGGGGRWPEGDEMGMARPGLRWWRAIGNVRFSGGTAPCSARRMGL